MELNLDFKHDMERVIQHTQHIDSPRIDNLLHKWHEAKENIIVNMFDGKLIYTHPEKITFELDEAEKDRRINDFIEFVYYTYHNEDLADFLSSNKDGFFANQVLKDWDTPKGKVPKGMKLVKSFKFFEEDKVSLEKLQNMASMIIQEDKVEGHLCFSVHPLDYLSSSENTYNWRSCHALDGEYRAGNISYMVDKSTIVVYLRGDKEKVNLPGFPEDVLWNSKKWRMLLFLDDNWEAAFAGKQYPFTSNGALETIRPIMLDLLKVHRGPLWRRPNWSKWHNDRIGNYAFKDSDDEVYFNQWYIPMGKKLTPINELVTDVDGSLHFNDLLNSSVYVPFYCFNKASYDQFHFTIGGPAPCVCCGEDHMVVTDSMFCQECELEYGNSTDEMFGTCDCCGRRVLNDDLHWVAGADEYVCDHCVDNECIVCGNCGDLVYTNDSIYHKDAHEFWCQDCWENRDDMEERQAEFSRMVGL